MNQLAIRSHGITDVGLLRTHNEDSFAANDREQVYVVADGMGGHNHGEIASRLAVASVREFLAGASLLGPAASWRVPGFQAPELAGGSSSRLKRSIEVAHAQILAAIHRDADLLGMGTTVVTAMLQDQTMVIAHVGDSRGYRRRGGRLELLTHDHTWVYEQIRAGLLSEAEAKAHPLRSVVTRALGGEADFEVDVTEAEARPGDLFLLCSDGLTTMLTDDEIDERMAADASLEEICHLMVNDANARGGVDNTTVVLQVEAAEAEPTLVPQVAQRRDAHAAGAS